MKKSELYARYNHWRDELIEIDAQEFNLNMIIENKDRISSEEDGSTYVIRIELDGWDYYSFSSHWSVGWHGDIDSDQYFCKIKTLTMAEMKEMEELFTKSY
jgi:hypothetical protein